ncbi:MAG TPA: DUF11 domain-containing protein, partial [Pyrinomonadaceae bacterium]
MPRFSETFRSFSTQSVRVLFVTLLVVISTAFAYQAKTAVTGSAIAAFPVTSVNNPHSIKSVFINSLSSSRSWILQDDLFNINTPVVTDTTIASTNTPAKQDFNGFLWQTSILSKMSADTDKPTVTTQEVVGPPQQALFTVRDTGSGLASIIGTQSENADTVIPPFTVGTTDPVVITATKIDQTQPMIVEIQVTDVAGNVTIFTYPAQADLSITKTDSPDPVTAGNQITYTVTVTNNGPSVASNVSLTDSIPAGTTFSNF